jgi:uncharacterized membrane protein YoaK (UPF0700 family)
MSDRTADERTGLLIVLALAALSGAVDACGFFLLKDLYVSFMSGNTTSMAAAFARGDWLRVGLIAGILLCFVIGTACGTVIGLRAGRRRIPAVILSAAGVLCVPMIAPHWRIDAMTFAMGMLNAALSAAGPVEVSVTYVTGTLARLGKGIGLLLCGQARDWRWLHQTVPWLGLVAGAALGTVGLLHVGLATLMALPAAALLIAAGAWLARPAA